VKTPCSTMDTLWNIIITINTFNPYHIEEIRADEQTDREQNKWTSNSSVHFKCILQRCTYFKQTFVQKPDDIYVKFGDIYFMSRHVVNIALNVWTVTRYWNARAIRFKVRDKSTHPKHLNVNRTIFTSISLRVEQKYGH
jgi:hypothetical protein